MTKQINWSSELQRYFRLKTELIYLHTFADLRQVFGVPIGEGRHRIVFQSHDKASVIKFPRNAAGVHANEIELEPDDWLGAPDRYAKTWLDEEWSRSSGLCIIRMEFVDTNVRCALPEWTYGVDCEQVGYTNDGRLVAYDWG